jgi:hypothetical protein
MRIGRTFHGQREGKVKHTPLGTKLLEDKATLLIVEKSNDEKMEVPWAPRGELVSIFALQPRKDIINAATKLYLAGEEEGVLLIRDIFPVQTIKHKKIEEEEAHLGLLLLVQVTYEFVVYSEKFFPVILHEAQNAFARRRSMTHTILEATGCTVTMITGKRLSRIYFQGIRPPEGITVFKDYKGFHSNLIDSFLRLDQVPSREIYEYPAPNLPVTLRLGTRMRNPVQPVGFPR